jgi:hypothetical protein
MEEPKTLIPKRLTHLRSHIPPNLCKCCFPGCSRSLFKYPKDLLRHINDVHNTTRLYKCPVDGCKIDLSVFNLRAGLLRADKGSINIPEDVINRITIPTDPEEKFVCHSEWLTAAALTQTYAYMIETGLEYSKLVTGEADVFLRVQEDEAHTLYYHLAEPNIEAEAQSEVDILLFRTAVGQTLTFCLMALDSKPRGQKWRNHALETAYRAIIDHDFKMPFILLLRRLSGYIVPTSKAVPNAATAFPTLQHATLQEQLYLQP